MATFTWQILNLDCYPQKDNNTNVVYVVYWRCRGEQDGYNAVLERNTKVEYTDGNFTPFDQLTESQVMDWVWNAEAYKLKDQPAVSVKDATESEIQKMLDALITPPVVSPPLPWAN